MSNLAISIPNRPNYFECSTLDAIDSVVVVVVFVVVVVVAIIWTM